MLPDILRYQARPIDGTQDSGGASGYCAGSAFQYWPL